MKRTFFLFAIIALFFVLGCEKEIQDESIRDTENLAMKKSQQNQNNSGFPYILDKINIDHGNINIFIHHQGNKAEHEFQLNLSSMTYSKNNNGMIAFLSLADITFDQNGTKKSFQELRGKLNLSDSILFSQNFQVEFINLSDTTFEIQFEVNNREGSWQDSSFSDLNQYLISNLTLEINDSTLTDSLIEISNVDSLILDSLYSDSGSISIDSIYNDSIWTDPSFPDSGYIEEYFNDSSFFDSTVIVFPDSDSTFVNDSSFIGPDTTALDSISM